MKDYKIGKLYCRCLNAMRIGKPVKIYQYTPKRKRCSNCGKQRKVFVGK